MPFPLRVIRKKSSQHVLACVEGDGAICSKNRKFVPYDGASALTVSVTDYGSWFFLIDRSVDYATTQLLLWIMPLASCYRDLEQNNLLLDRNLELYYNYASPRRNVTHYKNFLSLAFGHLKLITEPLHLTFSYLINKRITVTVVIPVHSV